MEKLSFNTEEAAEYLNISTWHLRRLCQQRKIPHHKIGTKFLFRKDTIDKWISKQEEENSINSI